MYPEVDLEGEKNFLISPSSLAALPLPRFSNPLPRREEERGERSEKRKEIK